MYLITVDTLSQTAEHLVRSGVRPSTRRLYDSAQKQYLQFCDNYGLLSLPASEQTLLMYIAHLYIRNLKSSTIKVYMSSVRSLHIEAGFDNPLENSHRIRLAIRAIEINQPPPCQKLPITLAILQQVHLSIQDSLSEYNTLMIWTAMCLGHFGCLRSGEFTAKSSYYDTDVHLARTGLVFGINANNVNFIQIHLTKSKTDTNNVGVDITIGCTNNLICAHCSMRQYCFQRDRMYPISGPLLLFDNGNILTREMFIKYTRMYLASIGIDPSKYSGHSYRIGGCTSAALAGLKDWELKRLGRWKSDTQDSTSRLRTIQ